MRFNNSCFARYTDAAQKGNPEAMYNLGVIAGKGNSTCLYVHILTICFLNLIQVLAWKKI